MTLRIAAATLLIAGLVVLLIPGANAGGPRCGNRSATIVGTAGDDVLTGTSGRDVIVGRGGNDRISGKGGNDFLCGTGGRDKISGGGGNDRIFGDAGDDRLLGDAGNDEMWGLGGDDTLRGDEGSDWYFDNSGVENVNLQSGTATGAANDSLQSIENVHVFATFATLVGNGNNNKLFLEEAAGVIRGNGGDDLLRWEGDSDQLSGGDGKDVFRPYSSATVASYDGGRGNDTIDFGFFTAGGASGVSVDLRGPSYRSIERLFGSPGPDTLTGNGAANVIRGANGADSLSGMAGDDRLDGQRGTNSNDGGAGTDVCENPNTSEGAVNCES